MYLTFLICQFDSSRSFSYPLSPSLPTSLSLLPHFQLCPRTLTLLGTETQRLCPFKSCMPALSEIDAFSRHQLLLSLPLRALWSTSHCWCFWCSTLLCQPVFMNSWPRVFKHLCLWGGDAAPSECVLLTAAQPCQGPRLLGRARVVVPGGL